MYTFQIGVLMFFATDIYIHPFIKKNFFIRETLNMLKINGIINFNLSHPSSNNFQDLHSLVSSVSKALCP